MSFRQMLEVVCNHLKPQSILEFGSGESTTIFARYGKVTAIEYDPPGDWYGVKRCENVTLRLVQQEENENFPHNLLAAMYDIVLNTDLQPGEDVLAQPNLHRGRSPKWDLAYIDGAVHVKGFIMDKEKPGWAGGDISYLTRTAIAGLCLPLCKYVLIDDISFVPALDGMRVETLGDRFCLVSLAGPNSLMR